MNLATQVTPIPLTHLDPSTNISEIGTSATTTISKTSGSMVETQAILGATSWL